MEYYDILGLKKDAKNDEITKAFREAALKFHPDKNPNNEEALKKFKLASEAFEVLNDPLKRAEYDVKGYVGRPPRGQPRKPPKPKPESEVVVRTKPPIVVTQMTYFGGGATGRNILAHLELTEQQFKEGGTFNVLIKRQEVCTHCFGDGNYIKACLRCGGRGKLSLYGAKFKDAGVPCPNCDATGSIEEKCKKCRGVGKNGWGNRDVRVSIPANCQPGHQITVHGEGEHAPRKLPGYLRVVCVQK